MWFPLLTLVLSAAICLSVVSFVVRQAKPQGKCAARTFRSRVNHDVIDSSMISECFHGVSFMKLRRHLPIMLGEYWIYVLAGIISITILMLLYSHGHPIGLLRWW